MKRCRESCQAQSSGIQEIYDFCNLIGSFCKPYVFVESGTQRMPTVRTVKHLLLELTTRSVESGTYDVICQFCTVKGMVVESEVFKAQNCALSKLSLPMHSNALSGKTTGLGS